MPALNLLIKPASSLCNMRCKYCFYSDVSENREFKSYGMMSEGVLELLVKRAFEYAEHSVGFVFQGGEPSLVGMDFYKKLIELQNTYNKNNIQVSNSIQTNGYIIDDEWARFFKENDFLVGLSLDGIKEAHDSIRVDANGQGTFERVKNAAEILRRHDVEFNILCVVNNFVARYPQKVYEQLKKYGYIQFIPCLDPFEGKKEIYSLSEERYARFLKQTFDLYYKDFMNDNYVSVRSFDNYIGMLLRRPPESCAMSGFCSCYGVIEGDGSVYPCDFYVLDEWRLGDIQSSTLNELFNSDRAKDFVSSSVSVSEKCKKCRYYALCRGGCRRERAPLENGNPGHNRHCAAYMDFFDYSIDRMIEMAKRIAREQNMKI